MGHLRSLNFTWCKCNPVERQGGNSARRPDSKVSGGKVAHSPGEVETSQRLIVFEPLRSAITQNMVISNMPMGGEGP